VIDSDASDEFLQVDEIGQSIFEFAEPQHPPRNGARDLPRRVGAGLHNEAPYRMLSIAKSITNDHPDVGLSTLALRLRSTATAAPVERSASQPPEASQFDRSAGVAGLEIAQERCLQPGDMRLVQHCAGKLRRAPRHVQLLHNSQNVPCDPPIDRQVSQDFELI
jgi:hypothetical protein